MYTYSITFSFRGPGRQDANATVRAYDSAEAEQILRKRHRGRELWIYDIHRIG